MRSGTWEFDGKQYHVYENGTIYGPTGIPLKYRPNTDGYPTVTVGREKRTRKTVHSIVAETFIPRPADPDPSHKYEIDHLDGNRTNFSVDNLEWVLHRENIDRATAKGSHKNAHKGERNGRAKLNPDLVQQMRAEYQEGARIIDLVNQYGYPFNTISNAVRRITWQHLPDVTG
ncbi:MAG: HNH endonuclease [Lachnospiraceae bacterium]|nr:HNH endonuclease [Lachnospiraceae bacterium]